MKTDKSFVTASAVPACPILPQCSSYWHNECKNKADHWLVDPEGNLNPGGHVCESCGRRIIKELAEKIGESWTMEPIPREPVTCATTRNEESAE